MDVEDRYADLLSGPIVSYSLEASRREKTPAWPGISAVSDRRMMERPTAMIANPRRTRSPPERIEARIGVVITDPVHGPLRPFGLR